MSQLPHPNSEQKFDHVQGDYGYRTVFGQEEIVHIPTNKSNMAFWKPETVLDPSGCEHAFFVTDIGKREIECSNCHWAFGFHAGRNYHEENGQGYVTIKGKKYLVSL